ncbi:MAG: hypothetical protein KJ559_02195 [Nanoarchaeota archaeon]|nr:hypothetical protein [Nanoarchaeota archaeon]
MALKKIMLSIPEQMFKKLVQEKKRFAYPTFQAIILEALRKRYYFDKSGKSKKGRPRDFDIVKAASRKTL